jgi:N-acetylmuramoyl-L-alanine amidase
MYLLVVVFIQVLEMPILIRRRLKNNMNMCINPGHGGFDSGAVGKSGLKEKDVNLKLALFLGKELTVLGNKITYTRTTDAIKQKTVIEDLENIVNVANNNKCDYLISLHENSADSAQAHGCEAFCNVKNIKGLKLATAIQNYTVQYTKSADRGIKNGTGKDGRGGESLYVIRHSNMTARSFAPILDKVLNPL